MLVAITDNEIVFNSERGSCETVTVYELPNDVKIQKKVRSYKTVHGLLSYCRKNLTLVKHHDPLNPPTVNTDNEPLPELDEKSNGHVVDSVGGALLASVPSEQTNNAPSDIVVFGSGVNPPPVAVSSPAASDTLILKIMQPQRLGAVQ